MKITSDELAVPGEYFNFGVANADGNVRISARVGGEKIAIPQCPDPPCHQLRVLIPLDSFGKTLTIHFDTADGDTETLKIRIAPPADESALVAGAE